MMVPYQSKAFLGVVFCGVLFILHQYKVISLQMLYEELSNNLEPEEPHENPVEKHEKRFVLCSSEYLKCH